MSVSISTSAGLYTDHGSTPINRAKEYVDGAFQEISPTGNTSKLANGLITPKERHNESFYVEEDSCHGQPASYDGMLAWWHDYEECNLPDAEDDSNILVLRDHSGGKAGKSGKYSVASGGNNLMDLPSSYIKYALESQYPGIASTILEEIGHNLQRVDISFHSERTGESEQVDRDWYVTPLGEGAQGTQNECDEYVEYADGMKHTWDQQCTVNNYWY